MRPWRNVVLGDESGLWEPQHNFGTPASYKSHESRKGVETQRKRRTRRGKMADRTAIASTFYITSTRIDIFKLILTSHPSSTLFFPHKLPFSTPQTFTGKYLMQKTPGTYPALCDIRLELRVLRDSSQALSSETHALFVDSAIDENLHFIAKRDRRSYMRGYFFIRPASWILQS